MHLLTTARSTWRRCDWSTRTPVRRAQSPASGGPSTRWPARCADRECRRGLRVRPAPCVGHQSRRRPPGRTPTASGCRPARCMRGGTGRTRRCAASSSAGPACSGSRTSSGPTSSRPPDATPTVCRRSARVAPARWVGVVTSGPGLAATRAATPHAAAERHDRWKPWTRSAGPWVRRRPPADRLVAEPHPQPRRGPAPGAAGLRTCARRAGNRYRSAHG